MRDEALAVHLVLGCLALTGDVWWQVVWLLLLVVGGLYSWAAVREQARAVFVPGGPT